MAFQELGYPISRHHIPVWRSLFCRRRSKVRLSCPHHTLKRAQNE
ncbi:MAG: hypothetical protein ACI4QP_01070 [Candidatus Enteromonas sp.]